jgi:hypothetical protein
MTATSGAAGRTTSFGTAPHFLPVPRVCQPLRTLSLVVAESASGIELEEAPRVCAPGMVVAFCSELPCHLRHSQAQWLVRKKAGHAGWACNPRFLPGDASIQRHWLASLGPRWRRLYPPLSRTRRPARSATWHIGGRRVGRARPPTADARGPPATPSPERSVADPPGLALVPCAARALRRPVPRWDRRHRRQWRFRRQRPGRGHSRTAWHVQPRQ